MDNGTSQNSTVVFPVPAISFTPTLIAFITLQQLVFVLACSGNAAVILIFIKYLRLESISNRVVVSLAVSDFLTGISAGFQIFYFFFDELNTSKTMCFARYRIVSMTTIASQLHVTLTTFDRYAAICHPHKYKAIMSNKIANSLIVFSWLYSLLIGLLPYFGLDKWSNKVPCLYPMIFQRNVYLCDSFSVFIFMLITFVLYIMIAKVAWRFMKKVHPVNETAEQRNNRLELRRNMRAARVWLIVTIAFCLCWAPFTVFPMGIGLGYNFPLEAFSVSNWLVFLGISNSFMNALIYAWKRKDFRTACQKLFTCCLRNPEISENSTVNHNVT